MPPKLRIGVNIGFSVQVMGMDWIKPEVHAEIDFDEIPTDDESSERWDWLWENQVQPQADRLLDLMQDELRRRLGPAWAALPSVPKAERLDDSPPPSPPPPGQPYS